MVRRGKGIKLKPNTVIVTINCCSTFLAVGVQDALFTSCAPVLRLKADIALGTNLSAALCLFEHCKTDKMDLEGLLNYRRAVKIYDPARPLDTEKVKRCLELATLAPSSSNMQLWEFYHITDKKVQAAMKVACMNQASVGTASDIVVFVTRQDLYKMRSKAVLDFEIGNIARNSPETRQKERLKDRKLYYGRLMPLLYSRFLGLIGLIRKGIVYGVGLFRPVVYEVSEADIRVVVHKSCALAAQTFMIAMANEGYDTCPLEGFDSKRIKKILGLPNGSGINMIIPCGIRAEEMSIWGERFRVPFEQVYHRV